MPAHRTGGAMPMPREIGSRLRWDTLWTSRLPVCHATCQVNALHDFRRRPEARRRGRISFFKIRSSWGRNVWYTVAVGRYPTNNV